MTAVLRHRGPDGTGRLLRSADGVTRAASVFLGHCRLKIIDLSDAARQPLANEDGTVWVVFNGEIYNFAELRRDAEARGHVFRSRSDTETIVHGYEIFGDDVVQRLDGMFAFALWDARRQRLLLARDRTGKKPLFYRFDGQRITFASEIKAILACPWTAARVAVDRLPELLTFGYVHAPATLFEGVLQLPPASTITLDQHRLGPPRRYWHLTYHRRHDTDAMTTADAAGRVRELLADAVARRLVADVPLGALLSGGLDSSIVVSVMAQLRDDPVRTFTIGWLDDASFDERPYAALAARHFRTHHTEFVVRPDAVALMETLVWHHDHPFGDSSAIPTYLISQLARQHVTVALNGDGGDEVFGGYDRFLAALVADRLPPWLAPIGRAAAAWLPRHHGYYSARRRLERFFDGARGPTEHRFLGWLSVFDPAAVAALLRKELAALVDVNDVREPFMRSAATGDSSLLHRLLHASFMTYLPDDLHTKMDRMSMAHALETRSPMLDTALVEFVASLPPSLKIRGPRLKYVLRRAFRDRLPPPLLARRKHGFSVPTGHWFRRQLRPYLDDTLLSPTARCRHYLDPRAVRRLVDEHAAGTHEHRHRLWLLLTLEIWLRLIEDGRLWRPGGAGPATSVDLGDVAQHCHA
jgi:asparagine synthase (glutamine-hydrolysing)